MDIVCWKVSFMLDIGEHSNTAGPAVTVILACRVCGTEMSVSHGLPVSPKEVETGKPFRRHNDKDSWFEFAVNSRIAHHQYVCKDCGVVSKVPPRQAAQLLPLADKMVTHNNLVRAIRELNVQVRHVPETDNRYAYDVYAGKNGDTTEYDFMAWCDFTLA